MGISARQRHRGTTRRAVSSVALDLAAYELVLRSSPCAHRVLDARRRRQGRAADQGGRAARHACRRHDRPRQHVRRRPVLPNRQEGRDQADHRHRGLRRAQQPLSQEAGLLGRGPPAQQRRAGRGRRRLRRGRVHAHDHARGQRHRPAQPLHPVDAGQHAGLLPQAAHGPRADLRVRRGHHRHHRLPVRGGPDAAAPRPDRGGDPGGRGLPGHLRQGELLPRADGPRAADRAVGPRGPARHRAQARAAAAGDQRLALRHPGPVRGPLGAAVRAVGQDAVRSQPLQVRRRRLLPEVRRGHACLLGQGGPRSRPTRRC